MVRIDLLSRVWRPLVVFVVLAATGTFLGLSRLEWPWFSLWLVFLALLGFLPLAPLVRTRLSHAREICLAGVLIGVFLFNAHLYYIESVVQSSERLDVVGVFFDRRDALRVGVGRGDVDVRLGAEPYQMDRWAVRVSRDGDGFRVDSVEGVDMLFVRERGLRGVFSRFGGSSSRVFAHGTRFGGSDVSVIVHPASGAPTEIFLEKGKGRGALVWQQHRAPLSRPDEILDERLENRLRQGISLDELPWDALPNRALAADLVLVMRENRGNREFRLVSRSGRVQISSPEPDAGSPTLEEGDTLWVGARGKSWAFAVGSAYETSTSQKPALTVSFVRNPQPRGWHLLPEAQCRGLSACVMLISSHRLPPPQPHFEFSGFGLDTARYTLLGRLERGGDGFQVVTADSIVQLPTKRIVPLTASAVGAATPRAGYLLKVDDLLGSRLPTVWGTLLLLEVFLGLALGSLRLNPEVSRSAVSRSAGADAAWTLLSLFIVFLGLRFAMGFRVAYAAPFYERGADAAVGMWVVFSLLLLGLGLWPFWTPYVYSGWNRVADLALRGARRVRTGAYGFQGMGAADPLPRPAVPLLLAMGAVLALLAFLLHRPGAVGYSLMVAGLILLTWVAVAIVGTRHDPGRFVRDPFTPLVSDDTEKSREAIFRATAWAVGAALVVQFQAGAMVILGGLAVLWSFFEWFQARRSGDAARIPGRAAVVLRLLGAVAGGFLLQRVLPEGPTMRFLCAFLVFLLGLRAGVAAATLAEQSPRSPRVSLLLLVPPVIVLLVLTAFDFGLGLMFFIPMLATVLLATGISGRALAGVGVVLLVGGAMVLSVIWPGTAGLKAARGPAQRSAEFGEVGNVLVDAARALPLFDTPITRATIRSLSAREPGLVQEALAYAGRSRSQAEALRALEQVWGGRAYAARGWVGDGFASTDVFDRGVPATTSYAENTFSVYVLSEHGAIGGLVVLGLYLCLLVAVALWLWRTWGEGFDGRRRAAVAVAVGGVLWIVLPGAYVAGSNLGALPLTGQNMPFLGLNAWSDVVLASALSATMLGALVLLSRESVR